MSTRTFLRVALVAVVSAAFFSAPAFADGKDGECPIEKKVTVLLASWKTAAAESKAMTAVDKERIAASVSAVASKCPVGSRVGETLAAVRDSLAIVVASTDECAKHCPLENAFAKGVETKSYAAAKKLQETRTKALRQLHQLATYSAGFTGGDGCCAASKCAKTGAATNAKTGNCADGSASCPIRVASRLGTLKASWTTARNEAATLTAAKKQEIHRGFQSLCGKNKAVALVPQSVLALAEGLAALESIDEKMHVWAKANPELMRSVPESGRRAFLMQGALLGETRSVLNGVKETIATMHGEAIETARK